MLNNNHSAVILKKGCLQGVARDLVGEVIPYFELNQEEIQQAWVDGLSVRIKHNLYCFSKQAYENLIAQNLLKFIQ
jgi:hypothetical protein